MGSLTLAHTTLSFGVLDILCAPVLSQWKFNEYVFCDNRNLMTWRKEIFSIPFFLRDLQDLLDVYPMGVVHAPWGRHIRDISHFWFPPVTKTRRPFLTCCKFLLAYAQLLSMETPLLSHFLALSWDLARGHTRKHELGNMQGYWPSKHALTGSTLALAPCQSVRWLLYYILLFRQVLSCSTSSCCKVQSGLSISTS